MPLSFSTRFCCAVIALSFVNCVYAQDYPVKPVRVVTSSAGSGTDFIARQISQGLSSALSQQVVVENRPSGVVPGEVAARAAPDGYTLLVEGNMWIGALMQKTPYDVERDFAPISMAARSPSVLVVHPSLPVKSTKELIALAKARPGELNFGSARAGGGSHLSAELFKKMAHVNIVWIRYKGSPQSLTGVMGGEVQMMITDAVNVPAHIKSGRLRALGVTSAEPTKLAPGILPLAATLPGYEYVGTTGVFAPAKTPAAIINRLNMEIVRMLRSPETIERLLNSGTDAVASSPSEFAARIQSEIVTWSKLIKDLNIAGE